MSRKLRRLQEKKQKTDLKQMQKAYQRQAVKISQEVAAETEEFAKHHMTGQLLTAMALVLRKVYGWYPDDDFYCGYAERRSDEL